jgi:protease-4
MSEYPNQFQAPPPYIPMAKRKRSWILPTILIAIILFLISLPFIIIGGIVGKFSTFESKPIEINSNTVLTINLNSFSEAPTNNPFQLFSENEVRNTLFDIVNSIKAAAEDKNIKGIVLKPGLGMYGFGKAKEISDALINFKKSGKFIYAYLPWGNENTFYIASVADSIFAPSMGFVEMNGYGLSTIFFKNFFDKIGVNFYVEHFEDYKSAGEQFSRANYSDSSKKQLRLLIEERFDELISQLSKNRNIDKKILLDAINRGQYTIDSLMKLGLVDGIATPKDFEDKVFFKVFGKEPTGKECDESDNSKGNCKERVNYLDIAEYAGTSPKVKGDIYDKSTKIAIIQASGAISSESQDINIASNNEGITDGRMVNYLEEARKDKDVKAIIIRIDSPGGSALASDNIWQEIMKVRKEKPVYASMSDVAASGGYYISMACDTIVAYPQTITGSIGVISMIPNASGLLNKIGLTSDTINVGNNSQFLNGAYPFTEYDKKKFRDAMQTIYFDFVSKAAKSRKKTFEELRSVAKGRVWTGQDALKVGLIDVLGNYQDAINIAKKRIGIPTDKKVLVDIYPKPGDKIEEFVKFLKNLGNSGVSVMSSSLLTTSGWNNSDLATFSKVLNALPEGLKQQVKYNISLMEISKNENILLTMPFYPSIK